MKNEMATAADAPIEFDIIILSAIYSSHIKLLKTDVGRKKI
jgi:hypothetical protein